MATRNLTGKAFQHAHLALCKDREKRAEKAQRHHESLVAAFIAVAIFVGIVLGLVLLATYGAERGEPWAVGNYRTEPCWNDF